MSLVQCSMPGCDTTAGCKCADALRLHHEKMDFFDRVVALESQRDALVKALERILDGAWEHEYENTHSVRSDAIEQARAALAAAHDTKQQDGTGNIRTQFE